MIKPGSESRNLVKIIGNIISHPLTFAYASGAATALTIIQVADERYLPATATAILAIGSGGLARHLHRRRQNSNYNSQ